MILKFMSDTHGFHQQEPLEPVDILIHSGDATNSRDFLTNKLEWESFWSWFCEYPAKYRIYVPGNHDVYVERSHRLIEKPNNTHILIHSSVEVEGLKIFGSPYTPTLNDWVFMKSRNSINRIWEKLPDAIDVLITHGPPKNILDSVAHNKSLVERVGDSSLYKKVLKIKPKIHAFGHVHDNEGCLNHGIFERLCTKFINASQVIDNEFEQGLVHKGIIIEWK